MTTMLHLVDRCTPANSPDVIKVKQPAPFGMFLGQPLLPPLSEVNVQVTSFSHIPDMWWIGPYLTVSDRVLQFIQDTPETHFEVFPLTLIAKKQKLREAMFVLNLL